MGFILFLIPLIFIFISIIIIYFSIKSDSKHNSSNFIYYGDDFPGSSSNNPDSIHSQEDLSSFPYPDPYEISPDKAVYINDHGELLDDL